MHTLLHHLLSVKVLILLALVAAASFVHFRGKVRHKFSRQLLDHSTFMAPYNALIYAFSKVPAKPFLRTEDFPDLHPLTNAWREIREEGMRLLDEGKVRAAIARNDIGFNSFFRTGWKRFYLKWYDDTLPSAAALCPRTVALLNKVPSVHGAMFTLLPPGARLGKHRDPFAGSLRYHLGLSTPNSDDCFIEVDGERRGWRDGEAMIFDETYIHMAENKTDTTRLILFCDVDRPLRGRLPRAINHFVVNHLVKTTATQNEAGEKVGFLNQIYAGFYALHQGSRRMKQWNRKVYYAAKYVVIAGALALIIFA